VVLVGALVPQGIEHVLLARVGQRLGARRHAAIDHDDREVARQADQHEGHARHPDVHRGERDEQRVRDREHRGPHDQVGASGPFGQRDELDRQTGDHQAPPPRAKGLEPLEAPAEQVSQVDREQDDGEQQLHRRVGKRPTR